MGRDALRSYSMPFPVDDHETNAMDPRSRRLGGSRVHCHLRHDLPWRRTGVASRQREASDRSLRPLLLEDRPPGAARSIETEEKSTGFHDFWFRNDNEESVKVGLDRMSCKCSSIELFLLPESSCPFLYAEAVALWGNALPGVLSACSTRTLAAQLLRLQEPTGHELLKDKDFVDVPGGGVGWVRMKWKGERPGPQAVSASLWMDIKDDRDPTILQTRLYFHEPLRVNTLLPVGLIPDEKLSSGVTYNIICWSSTRTSLRLVAERERPQKPGFRSLPGWRTHRPDFRTDRRA